MATHPNPPTTTAAPTTWARPNSDRRVTVDQGRYAASPAGLADAWPQRSGVATADSTEATAVLARPVSGFVAYPRAVTMPAPWGMAGRPGAGHPPVARRRPNPYRTGAWVGGAAAAVIATIACVGLIAAQSRSDTTAPRPAARPTSSSPNAAATSTPPSPAPPAATVPLAALSGLLLDAAAVNRIEGVTDIQLIPDPNADSAYTGLTSDRPDCEGIPHPGLAEALRGSGYLGVQTQALRGDNHLVAQAVIAYPSAMAATQFAAQQAQTWAKCNDKSLTLTTPAEGSITFTVGTVTNNNDMLSVVFTQEGARGWACQRALTPRNNIVVDTRSCGFNRTDQATRAAARIAERVSTQ